MPTLYTEGRSELFDALAGRPCEDCGNSCLYGRAEWVGYVKDRQLRNARRCLYCARRRSSWYNRFTELIGERDGWFCCDCGIMTMEGIRHIDHIIPWWYIKENIPNGYGRLVWEPANLRLLCAECNLQKGATFPDELPAALGNLMERIDPNWLPPAEAHAAAMADWY